MEIPAATEHTFNDRSIIAMPEPQVIPASEGAPYLHHEALNTLFVLGADLPAEAPAGFLRDLPADTLAADCCAIMRGGLENYERLSGEDEIPVENWAVVHAYFIAGATRRPEVVRCLLDVLAAHPDVLDFYFGDILTEECWWPLRQYLPAALDEYIAFLRRDAIDEMSRSVVLSALLYAAYAEPEAGKRIMTELISFARDKLAASSGQSEEPDFILTELALRFIDDGSEEGASLGKAVYESGLADESVAGDLAEVLADRGTVPNTYEEEPYKTLADVYEALDGYKRVDYSEPFAELPYTFPPDLFTNDPGDDFYDPQQPIVKGEKIGRNDPCPCGSGKKYKKCCLGKA